MELIFRRSMSGSRFEELDQTLVAFGLKFVRPGQTRSVVGQIRLGVGQIRSGVGQIRSGVGQIRSGVGQTRSGVGQILVGVGQILVGVGSKRSKSGLRFVGLDQKLVALDLIFARPF